MAVGRLSEEELDKDSRIRARCHRQQQPIRLVLLILGQVLPPALATIVLVHSPTLEVLPLGQRAVLTRRLVSPVVRALEGDIPALTMVEFRD